jgi:hypothetical protein
MAMVATLAAFALAAPIFSDEPPTERKIRGEVVAVRQLERTGNQGALDELTVRTKNGQMHRLVLGEAGGCVDCVRVGDRIRARVSGGEVEGSAQRVRSMQVKRSGERFAFGESAGQGSVQRTRQADRTRTTQGVGAGRTHGRSGR